MVSLDIITLRTEQFTCGLSNSTFGGSIISIAYNASGYANQGVTLKICDDRTGEIGREIIINNLGRPRTNSQYQGCT